jgi:hypothetical protein
MSAVLLTPTLPTLVNMEELKGYIQSEIEKGIEKALPAAVEKALPAAVENFLLNSEMKVLKRINFIEGYLGLDHEVHRLPEDNERFIQKQELLTEKRIRKETEVVKPLHEILEELGQSKFIAPEKPVEENPIIPETTLDLKACAIKDNLLENVKPRNGIVYMNSKEFYYFMKNTISENLRWNQDIGNPRQGKKDIIERAFKMYPDILNITKSLSKTKVTGMVLKPSVKCRDTDT